MYNLFVFSLFVDILVVCKLLMELFSETIESDINSWFWIESNEACLLWIIDDFK